MNKTHHHILLSIKNSKKIINIQGTKYPIIKQMSQQLGFQISSDFYTYYWTDFCLSIKQIREKPNYVRINHLPEIMQLTRKNRLTTSINSMKRFYPKQYDFYPETWLLPTDHSVLLKKHTKDKYYIVKPENSCQGKGIFLINNIAKLDRTSPAIVQKYITNPMLIDGLKFDLRIYVLITCVQPLRVYLYNDGIVRLATQQFERPAEPNLKDLYKHLTNYAINKGHEQFRVDDEDYSIGHKRLLSSIFSPQMLSIVQQNISDLVIKTIISALPCLQNAYSQCKKPNPSSCFQLLGFDVLLSDNGKLNLLQVNQNPSLMTQTPIDKNLKGQMVKNIFQMMQSPIASFEERNDCKIKLKDKHETSKGKNFKRIYPCSQLQDTQYYDEFIGKSQQLYKQKFGINIVRNSKKEDNQPKQQLQHVQWNQSNQFYSKDKLEKVYGGYRKSKTSQRKRLMFY